MEQEQRYKFRGKEDGAIERPPRPDGDWEYGFLYKECKDISEWTSGGAGFHWAIQDDEQSFNYVNIDTVGQYIGRKDRNKVEIYEDDVVRVYRPEDYTDGREKNNDPESCDGWYVVIYNEEYAKFEFVDPLNADTVAESIEEIVDEGAYIFVVGNIHDHKGWTS